MNNNLTNLFYKGSVNVSIKIKDKIINLKSHNNGLPFLARSFCEFILGHPVTIENTPQYIDLRAKSTSSDVYESILLSRIHLSGKTWQYDESAENYVATFTAVISYNSLKRAITRQDSDLYRLYLYTGSLGYDSAGSLTGYYDLAFLDISADDLSYISPGTQATIQWSMQLLNYEGD